MLQLNLVAIFEVQGFVSSWGCMVDKYVHSQAIVPLRTGCDWLRG